MLPEHQMILRLVVAAVLGSIVGIEREQLNWVAGLRTHMLVCWVSPVYDRLVLWLRRVRRTGTTSVLSVTEQLRRIPGVRTISHTVAGT